MVNSFDRFKVASGIRGKTKSNMAEYHKMVNQIGWRVMMGIEAC